ncbi:hypothetical protein FCY89_23585 [Escherichia coli]|nr:hypothetical protein [Escherichia coli]
MNVYCDDGSTTIKLAWNDNGKICKSLSQNSFRHGWKVDGLGIRQTFNYEPRQPGGCKLKTAPVRPVVAARPAEYVCSEDLFY